VKEGRELQPRAGNESPSALRGTLATHGPILRRWIIGLVLASESSLACVVALLLLSWEDWIVPLVTLLLAACSLIAAFLVIFGRAHRTPVGIMLVWVAAASNLLLATWLVVTSITTPHSVADFAISGLLAAPALGISAALIWESRLFADRC
jgi:hypothetical protein